MLNPFAVLFVSFTFTSLLQVSLRRMTFSTVVATTNTPSTAVFIGDSLTQWFLQDGRKVWDKYYAPLGCINVGVAGDVTQQTIDRLNGGILKDLKFVKLSVVLIGTNDIGRGRDEVYIANQIEKIVELVRIHLPGTKILLLGILPRGSLINPDRASKINGIISKYDEGNQIRFLDMTPKFSLNGRIVKELYWDDGLHLSTKGYQAWAETMTPLFDEMIRN